MKAKARRRFRRPAVPAPRCGLPGAARRQLVTVCACAHTVVDIGAVCGYHLCMCSPSCLSGGATTAPDPAQSALPGSPPQPCQSPRPRTASCGSANSGLGGGITAPTPCPSLYPPGCRSMNRSVGRSSRPLSAPLAAPRPAPSLLGASALSRASAISRSLAPLGCSDPAWRDPNHLGAGDAAAPLLPAGSSGSAPDRRGQTAAQEDGGVMIAAGRRSPSAASSPALSGSGGGLGVAGVGRDVLAAGRAER